MPPPRSSRLGPTAALVAATLAATSNVGCDPGNEVPGAPIHDLVAPPPLPGGDAVDGSADADLCRHIVDVSHRELGHLGELDPEGEAAALADCRARVVEDRGRHGLAFAPLAECTRAADTLAQIAACEDHYAAQLEVDSARIADLSLEEPIVDAELCMHRARISADPEFDPNACRVELGQLRARIGNRAFDRFAWCMMDAANEAGFLGCESEAEASAPPMAPSGLPGEPPRLETQGPDPAAALTALAQIQARACRCSSVECAAQVRDDLDVWTRQFRAANGTPDQQREAERLTAGILRCEIRAAGPTWLDTPAPEAGADADGRDGP